MTKARTQMQSLLTKIYNERGFDFRQYNESTLTRRLDRRLHARGVQTYTDYARVLDKDPSEYEPLFNELTINVTSFFRDKVAFKALEEIVLPALIDRYRDRRGYFRIWSAGCATGQEPYSIAVLLLEALGFGTKRQDITILATDIDAKVLERARKGIFSPTEIEGIRPVWLKAYFVRHNNSFHVQPVVREMASFREHNLTSDQPYYDIDLVVCRNVLIYFTPGLQTDVLKGFHEGLNEEGFLLLGRSEVAVGATRRLFRCVDSKAKLYQKVG